MKEFETPEPIALVVEVAAGDVSIDASDRATTVVDVRPSNPERQVDVQAAQQVRVEFASGGLLVKSTKRGQSFSPFGDSGSVDVRIDLPAGSKVAADAAMATLRCSGALGDARLKTSLGDIHVDGAASVDLKASAGDISLEHASGNAQLSTGTGSVRIGAVDGAAIIKNSNGNTNVGEIAGDLRVKAANGDIAIERTHGSLVAKTANGGIRVGAVSGGSVVAETALGEIEIGIADGTAAWLDLSTRFGRLANGLDDAEPPTPGSNAIEVRARTSYGDITIRRAKA
jgi:DUF4097 and DUF4098 domain-containing protein YvlB